jgi:hypothetical protein
LLVDSDESMMMHGLANRKFINWEHSFTPQQSVKSQKALDLQQQCCEHLSSSKQSTEITGALSQIPQ